RGGRQRDLLLRRLPERQPESAELDRNQRLQVPGGLQLLEVFGEEGVVAVVTGGAIVDAAEQPGVENRHRSSMAPRHAARYGALARTFGSPRAHLRLTSRPPSGVEAAVPVVIHGPEQPEL